MDRRVKERLIGACILVVLLVAIVPELLSGPKPAAPDDAASAAASLHLPVGAPEPVRNVTVDLATSKPARSVVDVSPTPPQPSVPTGGSEASSGQTSPAPASNGRADTDAPADTASANTAFADTARSRPLVSPAPVSSSGQSFTIQLGSFANRGNADKLLRQLKPQGYPAYINAEGSGRGARYRVRVGPLADRDSAERTLAKLKASGHAGSLVSSR